jgi:hypothetical protein
MLAWLRSVLEPEAIPRLASWPNPAASCAIMHWPIRGKLHRRIELATHRPVQDNLSTNHYCSSMQPAERFLPLNVSGPLLLAFPARIL